MRRFYNDFKVVNYPFRHFSATPLNSLDDYCTRLAQLAKASKNSDEEFKEYIEHVRAYDQLVQGLEGSDAQASLKRLCDVILKHNTSIQYVVYALNAYYDSQRGEDPTLQEIFVKEIQRLESNIMLRFKEHSPQSIVEAAYYFCKFKTGSDQFWNKISTLDIQSLPI